MNAPTWGRSLPWALILEKSKEHKLDPMLVAAIVMTESNGDPWAVRYEPDYSYLVTPQVFSQRLLISLQTEVALQKFSYSYMQLMGANFRALGYAGHLTQLCSTPSLALEYGCKHLSLQVVRYDGEVQKSIAAYNAGVAVIDERTKRFKNQHYVDRVLFFLGKR
jgi:soluble lytic murein transglycosylase-like protein